ncbi:type II toxin-antitoxin system RelE/ParE family toxin [Inhella sp.]|uniref:type II toxin-antitoxin system RelE/ParE family toxin n=1 Tax=Inhella sp. TaxID=1921806 RepID=UPI0035B2F8C7
MKPAGFAVRFTAQARADLQRLLDFLIDRARQAEDLGVALDTIDALEVEIRHRLASTPYLYRHPGPGSQLRELVIPAAGNGYLALYDITDARQVTVIAVRHQLEDDYL